MSEEFEYEVNVTFTDGTKKFFYSGNSFDAANGILYWNYAKVDNETLEYYAIPVSVIREIKERLLS